MPLAEVNTTILDGALGLLTQDLTAISAAVGVASSGTVNEINKYTKLQDAKDELGTGPLVEKLCFHIKRSGKPVEAARVNASVAGTIGSITKSNVSSPTITATGTVRDSYSVIIEITQTGVVASASAGGAFKYTVDGGDSHSPEIAIPAGGTATAATRTGTGDLSNGALYGGGGTLDGLTVIGSIDNGSSTTCTFVAPADKAAAVSQLNTAFDGSPCTAPGNFLVITSPTTGLTSEIDITGGTGLTALGLTVATVNGTAPPATYVLSTTGMTISFPFGTYTDGDTYTFTTVEPNYSLTNLGDALDVFLADAQRSWFLLHVVGSPTDEAAARAMADLLDTYGSDAQALHRFVFFVMEAADGLDEDDLKAEFVDFESTRVAVSYGYEELTSEATKDDQKRVHNRPSAWPAVARWAQIPISEKGAYVGRGKLGGVSSVEQAILDEAENMADARFIAIREVIGKIGYFLAEDCIMAPAGSDFSLVPYRRIMDVACTVVRAGLLNYLNARILVGADTGFIIESQAQAIEADVNSKLKTALVSPGHASKAQIVVTRDNNILSTQELLVETRITPPGYAKTITHTIGFNNPTIQEV